MRILSIGNFGTGWDGSICDEEHIAKALEELGHTVIRWQRENGGYPLTQGQTGGFDFILIAQWDGYDNSWFAKAKNYFSCPLVYWAFDYQAHGQEWHERLIKESDLYLSKRIADSKYSNWQWFSQDFAPQFLNRWSGDIQQDIDVLFTGSYLSWATERNATLKAVDEKFNLTVHSVTPDQFKEQGFKNVHGPVMDRELPQLIARAKVNLSIDHTLEAGYWSDRNAQIMACGGTVLFRYVPMSEVVFRDSVLYFYNIEDCLEKIKGLLANPFSLSYRIAEFAQNNLMVKNRVKDLLPIVRNIL